MIGLAIVLSLAIFAFYFSSVNAAAPNALGNTYTNAAYGFVVNMPEDFSAYPPDASPALDATGAPIGQAIVLQNADGAAVQIVVTSDPRAISNDSVGEDDLAQIAPYIDPEQIQSVQIAPGVTGITFTEPFNEPSPASTDVLIFTHRGYLYELSAETKNRALFEAMMDTWKFL